MNPSGGFRKVRFNPQAKVLFGQGLVGLDGEKWALHRRIANQAFNLERVKVCVSVCPIFLIFHLIILENHNYHLKVQIFIQSNPSWFS